MRIAVDLDDVLCNMRPTLLDWHNQINGTEWEYKDFTSFGLAEAFGIGMDEERRIVHKFHTEFDHAEVPIVAGAAATVAQLASEHELYVVTSRPLDGQAIAQNWVEHNFPGVFKAVVIANPYSFDGSKTSTKGEICKQLGCEILIDDDYRHMEELTKHGIKMLLMTKPWNADVKLAGDVIRVSSWDEVLVELGRLEGEERVL